MTGVTSDALRPLEPPRPLEPLWRGLLVYRVLALGSAGFLVAGDLDAYASPAGAVAV